MVYGASLECFQDKREQFRHFILAGELSQLIPEFKVQRERERERSFWKRTRELRVEEGRMGRASEVDGRSRRHFAAAAVAEQRMGEVDRRRRRHDNEKSREIRMDP